MFFCAFFQLELSWGKKNTKCAPQNTSLSPSFHFCRPFSAFQGSLWQISQVQHPFQSLKWAHDCCYKNARNAGPNIHHKRSCGMHPFCSTCINIPLLICSQHGPSWNFFFITPCVNHSNMASQYLWYSLEAHKSQWFYIITTNKIL